MQIKKQQLEPDMEKWTGSKLGKEYVKAVYFHPSEWEFQRTARREKKAFLSEQCKQIEESNRMAKTWDPFKKIGDIGGKFYARMGTIKERNGKDLKEA